ncbi:MATE family efflux transporter, partial [Desulfovibrio piger]
MPFAPAQTAATVPGPSRKEYAAMLLPFILSTVTQPLIGAVDTAVMGRLSDPAYIAGVAVGAVIFNTLYWLLGFLRVGSTGFSAQALATG